MSPEDNARREREDRLRALGFEEPTAEQRQANRASFLAFLEANAAEVATWPEWKQRAFRLVKDGER